jgi:hypothetical protein
MFVAFVPCTMRPFRREPGTKFLEPPCNLDVATKKYAIMTAIADLLNMNVV